MPRFATLFALLVMAATGLYPFGLLSSYLAMLTQPATAISWGLGVMTLSWFFVSWYLFRMMQRLLFGAHRGDIVYRDLRANEIIGDGGRISDRYIVGLDAAPMANVAFAYRRSSSLRGGTRLAEVATNSRTFSETQRMELRTMIRLASEVIANYWPMRTFVHHNPLHGLEDVHFDEAVRRAQQLLGGKGYLGREIFRDYYHFGRILERHLDDALKADARGRGCRSGRPPSNLPGGPARSDDS